MGDQFERVTTSDIIDNIESVDGRTVNPDESGFFRLTARRVLKHASSRGVPDVPEVDDIPRDELPEVISQITESVESIPDKPTSNSTDPEKQRSPSENTKVNDGYVLGMLVEAKKMGLVTTEKADEIMNMNKDARREMATHIGLLMTAVEHEIFLPVRLHGTESAIRPEQARHIIQLSAERRTEVIDYLKKRL